MNQFKHAKWWRSYLDKLWQSFWKLKFMNNQALELHSPLPKSFKVCKERTMEKRKAKWKNQRTAAVVFFCIFGVLPEVYFLHAIYHFKAQEVKNPTLQTVYDLELKWGRYGLRKTTASSHGNTISQGDFLHGAKFGPFIFPLVKMPLKSTVLRRCWWYSTAGSPRYFAWFLAL